MSHCLCVYLFVIYLKLEFNPGNPTLRPSSQAVEKSHHVEKFRLFLNSVLSLVTDYYTVSRGETVERFEKDYFVFKTWKLGKAQMSFQVILEHC
jgi:hypothetical protein